MFFGTDITSTGLEFHERTLSFSSPYPFRTYNRDSSDPHYWISYRLVASTTLWVLYLERQMVKGLRVWGLNKPNDELSHVSPNSDRCFSQH